MTPRHVPSAELLATREKARVANSRPMSEDADGTIHDRTQGLDRLTARVLRTLGRGTARRPRRKSIPGLQLGGDAPRVGGRISEGFQMLGDD